MKENQRDESMQRKVRILFLSNKRSAVDRRFANRALDKIGGFVVDIESFQFEKIPTPIRNRKVRGRQPLEPPPITSFSNHHHIHVDPHTTFVQHAVSTLSTSHCRRARPLIVAEYESS